MNKPFSPKDVAPTKVTTGPLAGSRKVYSAPEGHGDIAVPLREIALAASSSAAIGQPNTFHVYDTSGPYSDAEADIDVNRGLPPLRAPWIAARGGVEAYQGRAVKPEIGYIFALTTTILLTPNILVRGIVKK